jgi:hypothetical protein
VVHQHQHQQIIVQQTQIQHTAPVQLRHGAKPAPAQTPAPVGRAVNRSEAGPGRPIQSKPSTPPQREHPSQQRPEPQTGPAARATPTTPGRGPTQDTQAASPSPRANQPHPRQAAQQQAQHNKDTQTTPRRQAVAATAREEEERSNPRRAP